MALHITVHMYKHAHYTGDAQGIACVSGDGVADLISLNNLRRFGRSF